MKVRIIRDGPYWYNKGEEYEVGVDPSAYFTLQNPTRWIRKDDCEVLYHEERTDKQDGIQPDLQEDAI